MNIDFFFVFLFNLFSLNVLVWIGVDCKSVILFAVKMTLKFHVSLEQSVFRSMPENLKKKNCEFEQYFCCKRQH